MKVTVGAYSSVVGGSVHIHEDDGRFAGQIAIMCQTDTLRDQALQKALCEVMAKALTQFFETRQGADHPAIPHRMGQGEPGERG